MQKTAEEETLRYERHKSEHISADETIAELNKRGYRVEPHSWEYGDVQVIWQDGDTLIPASDSRDRGVSKVIDVK